MRSMVLRIRGVRTPEPLLGMDARDRHKKKPQESKGERSQWSRDDSRYDRHRETDESPEHRD